MHGASEPKKHRADGEPIGGTGSVATPNLPGAPAPITPEDDMFSDEDRETLQLIRRIAAENQRRTDTGIAISTENQRRIGQIKTDVWNVTVKRDGKSVPVIQELADAKTLSATAQGEAAGLRAALAALAAGKSLTAEQITEAARAGAEQALKGGVKVTIDHVDSETMEGNDVSAKLAQYDAILVPGGFGQRGVEGKIATARFAREHKVPYLGICLGMQVATIEYARHVAGLDGANSTEFDATTPHPVIALIEEWKDADGSIQKRDANSDLGGTMRLGAQSSDVRPGTLAHEIYGPLVTERHRHRYEANERYLDRLQEAGLVISAITQREKLTEIIELPRSVHPWFVGVQFHPEFKSTPWDGHPLFNSFIKAALARQAETATVRHATA